MGKAIESRDVNDKKIPVLNDELFKRVFLKEALALGLDKTREFRGAFEDYEDSFVFGAFVEKVLKPELQITVGDLRDHYEKNLESYTFPEMLRLQSLAFTGAAHAQSALEKLKRGTGLRWVRANAEGQVASDREDILRFGAGMVAWTALPEAARRALEGAQEGEYVLFAESDTVVHVLQVEKRVPARVQTLEEVQRSVLQDVYKEKTDAALRDWTRKLGEAYGVEVYAKEFSTP
ncbi:MAG: peptidylprolyl isomerase [Deferrisomatales bacterium]|nr:peptidylprolyl isomerase [Deferrisomatales bacterium]